MVRDFEKFHEIQVLDGFHPEVGRLVWMLEAARFRLYDRLGELEYLNTAVLNW